MTQKSLVTDIQQILHTARTKSYAAVNFAMVEAYWQVGRRIVEEEQQGKGRAEYGKQLLVSLSQSLTNELGKGFSISNLWNFRQFYSTFPDEKILYTLCRELTWSHCRLIMRVENPKAREYYLKEASEQGWSVRVLERNIHTLYYERLLSSQDKKSALATESQFEKHSPADFIKDPFVLEFLGLPEDPSISEAEMETAIITKLQKFLLELGKGFSFVGRQVRVSTETSHFYIDLVFYNFILKCFVLIDLKVDKLIHQDIGQMDMYMRLYDDLKRTEGDNPTIGIILCTNKDETVAKYSVLKDSEQIFASKYRLVLPSEEELQAELEREKRSFLRERAGEYQA
ncbi:MAG: PDDEXK nuclease domain-containing protein [Chloroflexota bacterium]